MKLNVQQSARVLIQHLIHADNVGRETGSFVLDFWNAIHEEKLSPNQAGAAFVEALQGQSFTDIGETFRSVFVALATHTTAERAEIRAFFKATGLMSKGWISKVESSIYGEAARKIKATGKRVSFTAKGKSLTFGQVLAAIKGLKLTTAQAKELVTAIQQARA